MGSVLSAIAMKLQKKKQEECHQNIPGGIITSKIRISVYLDTELLISVYLGTVPGISVYLGTVPGISLYPDIMHRVNCTSIH